MWEKFLKDTILDYATEESFLASMDANFNANNVMIKQFGLKAYKNLVASIEQCDKKILIALDRFDAISDDFRRKIKMDFNSQNEKQIFQAQKRVKMSSVIIATITKIHLIVNALHKQIQKEILSSLETKERS